MARLRDVDPAGALHRQPAYSDAFPSHDVPHRIGLESFEGPPRAQSDVWELGPGIHLLRSRDNGSRLSRSHRELRRTQPERAALALKLGCSGEAVVGGRREFLRLGAGHFVDQASEAECISVGADGSHAIVIDVDRLCIPIDAVRGAVSSLRSSPVYELFRSHLGQLCSIAEGMIEGNPAQSMVASATLELVRALITSAGGDERCVTTPLRESERTRVAVYIRGHLRDPRLCAETIAHANRMSVRQLYVVWGSSGPSLAEYIMDARLQGARHDLARKDVTPSSISAIAARWGFASPAHFSRRFRAAYSVSPLRWRQAAQERW